MNSRVESFSQRTRSGLGQSSVIRRIFLLGQELRTKHPERDVIDLSLGNPDLEPPPEVITQLGRLASSEEKGCHRYMDNAGFPFVREALAANLTRSEGVGLTSDTVFMTCGAAGALHILLRALVNPGDEVLLLAPFFAEYTTYVAVHGGLVRVVPLAKEQATFVPDLSAIEQQLSVRTAVLILNSPNNPSGCVYPQSFYASLAELLQRHHESTGRRVEVISDEPYAHLVFSSVHHPSVLQLIPGSWLVRSHSKDLGLAGERIGFIAWQSGGRGEDSAVIDGLRSVARALGFVNAPALMQRLLPYVLDARVDTAVYEDRARIFCDTLNAAGWNVQRPGGTFFVLVPVPLGIGDEEFAELLAEKGVLVVPAAAFGAPGFVRVSLTQDRERIRRAAEAMVSVCAGRSSDIV
jgi:aspartate aminotransferase